MTTAEELLHIGAGMWAASQTIFALLATRAAHHPETSKEYFLYSRASHIAALWPFYLLYELYLLLRFFLRKIK